MITARMGPGLLRHRPGVGVHVLAIVHDPAGQVDFAHPLQRQALQVGDGVVAMIAGIGVDVLQVQEEPGVRLLDDRPHELRLGHLRVRQSERVGDVLQQNRETGKGPLQLGHVPGHRRHRLAGEGERREMADLDAPRPGEGDVLREPGRRDRLGEPGDVAHPLRIEPLGAPEREADAVEEHRHGVPHQEEIARRRRPRHVLGDALDGSQHLAMADHLPSPGLAEAHAGPEEREVSHRTLHNRRRSLPRRHSRCCRHRRRRFPRRVAG